VKKERSQESNRDLSVVFRLICTAGSSEVDFRNVQAPLWVSIRQIALCQVDCGKPPLDDHFHYPTGGILSLGTTGFLLYHLLKFLAALWWQPYYWRVAPSSARFFFCKSELSTSLFSDEVTCRRTPSDRELLELVRSRFSTSPFPC